VIGTQVSADLPIGPGERIPGSVELRRETVEGWVRA
jgi:hypothetical protein